MTNRFATVEILNSKVGVLTPKDVLECMRDWIEVRDGKCHRITVTGFHGLWEAYRDMDVRNILNTADIWIADGIAPVLVAKLKGVPNMLRIPGAELMEGFFRMADHKSYRSFFYGDTEETLARLRKSLGQKYPGHRVCGTFSPPFRPLSVDEDNAIVRQINDAEPDVIWVGLGMPKQDRWIFEHCERLNAPVAVGVGAAFRFLAGVVRRVPKKVGDLGLEWLWRFAMEPKKLWRRDIVDGPQFLFHVGRELLGFKRYEEGGDELSGTH